MTFYYTTLLTPIKDWLAVILLSSSDGDRKQSIDRIMAACQETTSLLPQMDEGLTKKGPTQYYFPTPRSRKQTF